VLRELGWELSPGEMIPNVATRLHAMGFSQTPLLHTPVDLPPDLPRRSFVLLRPRGSVGEALGTAVLSGLQPGAEAAAMTPGMGGGLGKGIAPGPQPHAALTPQQAKALLDLIAGDPQLARTVIATLSAPAAGPPKDIALLATEAAPAVGPEPQSPGEKLWLEAAMKAAGAPR